MSPRRRRALRDGKCDLFAEREGCHAPEATDNQDFDCVMAMIEEKAMTETRERGQLHMRAADAAATTIADHNRKSMQLSGASALRSFEYLGRLAGAKTGMEAIEVSGAHYRNQLNMLGEHTDNLVDLARKMRSIC